MKMSKQLVFVLTARVVSLLKKYCLPKALNKKYILDTDSLRRDLYIIANV